MGNKSNNVGLHRIKKLMTSQMLF